MPCCKITGPSNFYFIHSSNRLGGCFSSHNVLGTINWKEGNISPIGSIPHQHITADGVEEVGDEFKINIRKINK